MPKIILPPNLRVGRAQTGDVVDISDETLQSLHDKKIYPDIVAESQRGRPPKTPVVLQRPQRDPAEMVTVVCPRSLRYKNSKPGDPITMAYGDLVSIAKSLNMEIEDFEELRDVAPRTEEQGQGGLSREQEDGTPA